MTAFLFNPFAFTTARPFNHSSTPLSVSLFTKKKKSKIIKRHRYTPGWPSSCDSVCVCSSWSHSVWLDWSSAQEYWRHIYFSSFLHMQNSNTEMEICSDIPNCHWSHSVRLDSSFAHITAVHSLIHHNFLHIYTPNTAAQVTETRLNIQ